MEGSKALVSIENQLSESSNITRGVRQGWAIIAILFIMTLHYIIEHLDHRGTIFKKS